ncbi:MAG: DUF4956 domain-containing protein, partial [Verrucomicrobiota bacterium]|nr:DUF4956 domain-containing protein [Verrucomicrobiota bacterium]
GADAQVLSNLEILVRLSMATIMGLIIGSMYRWTFTGKPKSFRPSMVHTQVLLCLGGALIWVIVGNNLARAFGLGGALSLIRFRTPVRDPKDTVVVFYSIIIGMACGLGNYATAVIGTGVLGLVLTFMRRAHFGRMPNDLIMAQEEKRQAKRSAKVAKKASKRKKSSDGAVESKSEGAPEA